MGARSFFNGHFKPKIVKIGPVMNSVGAAQNMKIFFYNRFVVVQAKFRFVPALLGDLYPSIQVLWGGGR